MIPVILIGDHDFCINEKVKVWKPSSKPWWFWLFNNREIYKRLRIDGVWVIGVIVAIKSDIIYISFEDGSIDDYHYSEVIRL